MNCLKMCTLNKKIMMANKMYMKWLNTKLKYKITQQINNINNESNENVK